MAIELRQAEDDDYEFVRRTHHSGLRHYVEDMVGEWDEAYQDERFAGQYAIEETRIILRDDVPVGWLARREDDDEIFLTEMYVAPEHRNQGIGTRVLRDLIDEARRGGKAVVLGVMKNSRARELYAREGFEVVGEDEHKYFMRLGAGDEE